MTYLCQPRLASLNPRLLTLEGTSFIGGMFKQLPLVTEEKSGMEFANRADCSPFSSDYRYEAPQPSLPKCLQL